MKMTITLLSLVFFATATSADGWAACDTPNPPFFCTEQGSNTGPQGPIGETGPQGPQGERGEAGRDGLDGQDGRSFNSTRYKSMLASSTALGGLNFRELKEGQVGWAAGVGGQIRGDAALAIGLNIGLTNDISMNASVSRSFRGRQTSVFVGISGRF